MRNEVALVSMPWALLQFPSISLGILSEVLRGAGIESRVYSYNLLFMDYIHRTNGEAGETLSLSDYHDIAQASPRCGLGDWIFALPPFRQTTPEEDAAYLALVGEMRGVSPETLDRARRFRERTMGFIDFCVDDLLQHEPAMVGFTSTFNQNVASLLLAKRLKERDPRVAIVFGGANCDGPMGKALFQEFPWVDVVVQGEGEPLIVDLVRQIQSGGPVSPREGVVVRETLTGPETNASSRNGRIQLVRKAPAPAMNAPEKTRMNDIPTPNYDFYFEALDTCAFRDDLLPRVHLLVETARGCWWGQKQHCTFCGLNGSSMAFRSKSIDNALRDFMALAERYKCLDFSAVDNIIELQYLRDLLPRLRESGLDLRIFYETKSNLARQQVRDMSLAGIRRIQPGIESLSTPILKLMRKGVSAWQNVQLLKWCSLFDIDVDWNLLYGFPNEPPEEYARMSAAMPSLTHLQPPGLNRLHVQRFSPYHTRATELGVRLEGPLQHYRFVYPVDEPALWELAYDFEYSYLDGRDPENYIGSVRESLEAWQKSYESHRGRLTYRVGPKFIRIIDRRDGYTAYLLEAEQAIAYLACDAGSTPAMVHRTLVEGGYSSSSASDVESFLNDLVDARLMFEADGRFVSLALPMSVEHDPSDTIQSLSRSYEPRAELRVPA